MIEYGYIDEDGRPMSVLIREKIEPYAGDDGKIHERTTTVEQQIKELTAKGWKPIDEIDESKIQQCEENYRVRAFPYDFGYKIGYRYEKTLDFSKIERNIDILKKQLADSDYKIIKSYEASLIGETTPYEIESLHNERQEVRDKINRLESLLQQKS